jgi:hypothetical protein
MVRGGFPLQIGPNSDLYLYLYCVFGEYFGGEGSYGYSTNMNIFWNMGVGDIETHTDRPRYFWGIGSTVGWETPRSIKIGQPPRGVI